MVHYVFWLFSGGAPASQPAGGGGVPKPPSHPAAARRSSLGSWLGEACSLDWFKLRFSLRAWMGEGLSLTAWIHEGLSHCLSEGMG